MESVRGGGGGGGGEIKVISKDKKPLPSDLSGKPYGIPGL